MLGELVALPDVDPAATAIHRTGQAPGRVSRGELLRHAGGLGSTVDRLVGGHAGQPNVWVAVRDPYLFTVAALGAMRSGVPTLVEPEGPAAMYDTLRAVCRPALLVCDAPGGDPARWARARDVAVHVVRPAEDYPAADGPVVFPGAGVQLFTSGTTGPPKAVHIGPAQLDAALRGMARRLRLAPRDVSLSVAPLTHTLGFVTTVLTALVSGGGVAFADPMRAKQVLAAVTQARPTWCAASPSALALVHRAVKAAGLTWAGLRFLRSSAAPITDELATALEGYHGVPVVCAYAMTEAPGEIASEGIDVDRARGSVGRPTLCQVQVRSGGAAVPAGTSGEVWVRGPNVVPGPSLVDGWLPTGDIGSLDAAGMLRLAGRRNDMINSGGLKIWPPDVEAAALRHPGVGEAVAFPIPHESLGEAVGLAVVPRPGHPVDRASVRRLLMAELPRHQWPNTIVVWDAMPSSARGKVSRRLLGQRL